MKNKRLQCHKKLNSQTPYFPPLFQAIVIHCRFFEKAIVRILDFVSNRKHTERTMQVTFTNVRAQISLYDKNIYKMY